VLAQVHRLRDKCEKLRIEVARNLFFGGLLTFGKIDGGYRAQVAHKATGEPVAALFNAKVSSIDRDGIMIRGVERDADGSEYKQAWWCLME
jgi:hypothetical protein